MKRIVEEIRKRFSTSTGSLFKFKKDVVIITLEDLEFALNRLKEERKIMNFSNEELEFLRWAVAIAVDEMWSDYEAKQSESYQSVRIKLGEPTYEGF